ncbi:unnamed protein product [Caenorhabditis brenneri]
MFISPPPTRISTKEIKFKTDVAGSEMFGVKWKSAEVTITHDLPACFKLFCGLSCLSEVSSGSSLPEKLSLAKVSYDPTKAPTTFDKYGMFIKFSDTTSLISLLIVDVIMVNNLESEAHDIHVTRFLSKSANDDALDCKVCLAPFSDHIPGKVPRILPACGHTICHTCARTLQKQSTNKLSIRCPFDRTVTNVTARKLPKNFAIVELVRERGERAELAEKKKAAEICEDPINPCYENPKHESTKYCKTCEVDFCDNCFQSAHSSKIFSSHQFDSVSHRRFRLLKCSDHLNQSISYFCIEKKCEASTPLCCNTCIESLHENHTTVPIEERAEQNERQLTKLLETLNSTEENMSDSLEIAKQNVKIVNNDSDEYQGLITTIKLYFEQKTEEAIGRLNSLLESKNNGLVKVEKDVERDLEEIREAKKEIEKILERKDTLLFTQEIIDKGEEMCKEANVVEFPMPRLQEIVDLPLPKTPTTPRKVLSPRTWFGL